MDVSENEEKKISAALAFYERSVKNQKNERAAQILKEDSISESSSV